MLPSDREKGEFYDIILGVSTRSLDMDAIESILMRFEQNRATIERFECEVSFGTFSIAILLLSAARDIVLFQLLTKYLLVVAFF